MSFSTRSSRQRIYNYTPALYQLAHQSQYQQFRAPSYYQPSQQQQDEEQQSIVPKPITVPSMQEQDQLFVSTAYSINQNHQYTYNAVSGTGKQGASVKKRVEMAFLSGLEDEVAYALKTLTEFSFIDPKVFSLKENPYILTNLIAYLDCVKIESDYESEEMRKPTNDNLNFTLDAALSLRNFSQVIENSAVMSMSTQLKEVLIKILNNKISKSFSVGDDEYEANVELMRYSLDIVESIASYLFPAPKDDPLFVSLLRILSDSEDRYTVVSILRSLSRLLVKTTSDSSSSAENINSKVLDQVTSYLLTASPLVIPDHGSNELLLASIDFLYQFCLAGEERIKVLTKSEKRAAILRTVLPRLLVHGLADNISTELKDQQNPRRYLKLVRRVKKPAPVSTIKLSDELFKEINALEEPERATSWMRCSYEPAFNGEVTQISLWKAYEAQFSLLTSEDSSPRKLLPAVDFIKNVSNAFPHSSAKVITQEDGSKKFVIKGVQPRQFIATIDDGNTEATVAPEPEEDDDDPSEDLIRVDLESSQQADFKLFNYGDNESISINEINTSSALLINCFVKTEVGNKLFEGTKDELLKKVLIAPSLFSHIYETLRYLDY